MITDEHGKELARANDYIGVATNNEAEYRALLLGLTRASQLGAREVEVVNDSQLVARQITGEYKVKKADLQAAARAGAGRAARIRALVDPARCRASRTSIADELVNEAIDARAPTA